MIRIQPLLAALLVSVLAHGAHGQNRPKPKHAFKDGPHVGVPLGGDVNEEEVAFGWQVAYEYNDYLSVDVSVSRQTDELDASDVGVPLFPDRAVVDLELYNVVLSGRGAYPLLPSWFVYAGAGVGYYWFVEDSETVRVALTADPVTGGGGGTVSEISTELDDDFGWHLAVGSELLLGEHWEIFIEYRFVYLETDSESRTIESRPTGDTVLRSVTSTRSDDFEYNHGLLRLGINYRF